MASDAALLHPPTARRAFSDTKAGRPLIALARAGAHAPCI